MRRTTSPSSGDVIDYPAGFDPLACCHLISGDGYLVHGIIDRLEQLQHGAQSLLQLTAVLLHCGLLQKLLRKRRRTR